MSINLERNVIVMHFTQQQTEESCSEKVTRLCGCGPGHDCFL